MNARERFLAALEFRRPDRIPVMYHPSAAGLYVHGTKLLELFRRLPDDTGTRFDGLPLPPPGTVDAAGLYHEVRRDAWGTDWEYLIFGIQGHPKRYPFAGWDEALAAPLPPAPDFAPGDPGYPRLAYGGSIFEKLHALRPMDEMLMDLFSGDEALLRFIDRLVDYHLEINRSALAAGADVFNFGDDFGTQLNTIIPPALFRDIFVPRYRRLFAPIRQAGRKILFHSCGEIRPLLDDFIELGVDCLWPQLSLVGDDAAFLGRCREGGVALLLHPDRQRLIPLGTPAEIARWTEACAARYRDGGGIFYVEIENDAPWDNVRTLIESIDRMR